MINLAFFAFKQ